MIQETLELVRAMDSRQREQERRISTIPAMEPSTTRRDMSLMEAWKAAATQYSQLLPSWEKIVDEYLSKLMQEAEEKKKKKPKPEQSVE